MGLFYALYLVYYFLVDFILIVYIWGGQCCSGLTLGSARGITHEGAQDTLWAAGLNPSLLRVRQMLYSQYCSFQSSFYFIIFVMWPLLVVPSPQSSWGREVSHHVED